MSVSPIGFAGAYRRAREQPAESSELASLLGLVGYEVTAAVIESWTTEKRVEAEVYAVNVHLRASDCRLRRCPKPDWLPEPWRGPELVDGVCAGPTGTVLG